MASPKKADVVNANGDTVPAWWVEHGRDPNAWDPNHANKKSQPQDAPTSKATSVVNANGDTVPAWWIQHGRDPNAWNPDYVNKKLQHPKQQRSFTTAKRQRRAGGDTTRISKTQRLLQSNPCGKKYSTPEAREQLRNRFLGLLQISAIDCMVFRELHDDRSRPCFKVVADVSDDKVTVAKATKAFNDDDSTGTTSGSASSDRSTGDASSTNDDDEDVNADPHAVTKTFPCGSITSRDRCVRNKHCYVKPNRLFSGFTCKNRESPLGTPHDKCAVYYSGTNDKAACVRDPMCLWAQDRKWFKRGSHACQNKYSKMFTNVEAVGSENVLALTQTTVATPSKRERTNLYYPLHQYNDTERNRKDLEIVLKHFAKRCAPTDARNDVTAADEAFVADNDDDRDSAHARTHPKLPLVNVLEELYEVVEQDAHLVVTYEKQIQDVTRKDAERNADEWATHGTVVNQWMDKIMALYNVAKQAAARAEAKRVATQAANATAKENANATADTPPADNDDNTPLLPKVDVAADTAQQPQQQQQPPNASDASATADDETDHSSSDTLNDVPDEVPPADTPVDPRKRTLLCVQRWNADKTLELNVKHKEHNLLAWRNKGNAVFHYGFHLFFNSRHYFFDSAYDQPNTAPIQLTQLGAMKQVHKHIELLDLSVRLIFHVHRAYVRQVELRAYVRPEGSELSNRHEPPPVRTVFVDKDGRRHHLLDNKGCDALWDEYKDDLTRPTMPFQCQTDDETTPRTVPVTYTTDGVNPLPDNCPSSARSGELQLPKALEADARVRVQANHCFRGWMGGA